MAARLVRDTQHEGEQYVGNVEKHAAYITGMGINYRDCGSSEILVHHQHQGSEKGPWKAGYPCPDFDVTQVGDATTTHHQRFYTRTSYGSYLLLTAGNATMDDTNLDHHRHDRDGGAAHAFGPLVTRIRLVPQKRVTAASVDTHATDGGSLIYATNFVSSEDSFAAVVRPDMYIAYVGTAEGAAEYLGQIFCSDIPIPV